MWKTELLFAIPFILIELSLELHSFLNSLKHSKSKNGSYNNINVKKKQFVPKLIGFCSKMNYEKTCIPLA